MEIDINMFVKTHQVAHLKLVNVIVYKVHLSKVNARKNEKKQKDVGNFK